MSGYDPTLGYARPAIGAILGLTADHALDPAMGQVPRLDSFNLARSNQMVAYAQTLLAPIKSRAAYAA